MTDVSTRELAELCGLNVETIRLKVKELPAKPGPNRQNLYDSTVALRLIFLGDKDADALDLSQERARLAKSQANITEMQEAELRNELVRGGEVETYWAQIIINAKMQLMGLPRRIGHLVLGVPTLGEVESVIAAEVEATLSELAGFVPLPSPADPAVVASAAATDDEPVGGPVSAPVERNQRRTRKVADKPRAVPKRHDGRGRRPKH
jgi:hypothetical protein